VTLTKFLYKFFDFKKTYKNVKFSDFNKVPTSFLKMIWMMIEHVGEFLNVLILTF